MSWNYRVVRYTTGGFGLHEVHYDANNMITSRTANPCGFACNEDEGPEGIVAALELALKNAKEKAVVQDPFD